MARENWAAPATISAVALVFAVLGFEVAPTPVNYGLYVLSALTFWLAAKTVPGNRPEAT